MLSLIGDVVGTTFSGVGFDEEEEMVMSFKAGATLFSRSEDIFGNAWRWICCALCSTLEAVDLCLSEIRRFGKGTFFRLVLAKLCSREFALTLNFEQFPRVWS